MIALIIQCLVITSINSLVDISASQTSLPQEMLNPIPYTVSHPGDESVNEESVRAVTPSSTSREPQVSLHHPSYLPPPKPSSPTGGIITDGVGYIYSNNKTIIFDRNPVSTSPTPPRSSLRSDEMGRGPGMMSGPGLGLGSQIGTITPSSGMGPVSRGISIGSQFGTTTFSSSTIITTPTNVTLVSAKPSISNLLYSSAVPTGSLPPYNLITPQSRMISSLPPPLSHMPVSVTLSSSLLTISTASSLTTSKPPVTISPESSIHSNVPVYTSSVTHSTTPISLIHSNVPVYISSVTTPVSLIHSNVPVYTSSVTHSTTPISLIHSNVPVYTSSVTTPVSSIHSNVPVYTSSVPHSTTPVSLIHSNVPVYTSSVTTPVSSIHSNVPFSVPHSNAPVFNAQQVSKSSTSTYMPSQLPFPGTQPSITKPPPTTLTNMSGIQSRLHGMQTQSSVVGTSLTAVPVSSLFVATQSSVTSTAPLTYSVNTVPTKPSTSTKPSTTSKQDSITTVTSTISSLSSSLTVPTVTKSFSFTPGANFSFGLPGGGMRSSTTSGPFVFGGSTPNSFTMFHTSAPLGHPPPSLPFSLSSPMSSLSSSQGINTSTAQTIHKPVPTTTTGK